MGPLRLVSLAAALPLAAGMMGMYGNSFASIDEPPGSQPDARFEVMTEAELVKALSDAHTEAYASRRVVVSIKQGVIISLTKPLQVLNRSITLESDAPLDKPSARAVIDGQGEHRILQLHRPTGFGGGLNHKDAAGRSLFTTAFDPEDDDDASTEAGGVHHLTLRNLELRNGYDTLGGGAGAVSVFSGLLFVSGCTFQHNEGDSGAVELKHSIAEIVHSTFDNNTAHGHGGALLSWISKVSVRHSVMRNNGANSGGALASLHGIVLAESVSFEHNEAWEAGAIFKQSSAEHNTLSVWHDKPHTEHAESEVLKLINCSFLYNLQTGKHAGHDLWADVHDRSEAYISGGHFESPYPLLKLLSGRFNVDCRNPPIFHLSGDQVCSHIDCKEPSAVHAECLAAVRAAHQTLPPKDITWHWIAALKSYFLVACGVMILLFGVWIIWPDLRARKQALLNEATVSGAPAAGDVGAKKQ